MIEINDILISDEILEERFTCDLSQCKGACCLEGEEGAPINEEESKILKKILPKVRPYLSEEGNQALKKKGAIVINKDNELKTPLIYNEGPCAYVIFEKNIAKCRKSQFLTCVSYFESCWISAFRRFFSIILSSEGA